MRPTTDVLVVGGGTAGCVLASRLSEDARTRVTLLEAGRDTPPGSVPIDIQDTFPLSYANPAYFSSAPSSFLANAATHGSYMQARVMGGGSSVMGLWAVRGLPDDYDGWGVPGWAYDDVLPFFRKLEHDADFGDPWHGIDGPTPLTRVSPERWPAFQRAVLEAANARGLALHSDLNAPTGGDGIYPLPNSTDGRTRASSASCYLGEAARRRDNLDIHSDAEAESLVLEGRRVVGVAVRRGDGSREVVRAARVIVACGAIHSPALLMRSGIGPASELAAAGIEPAIELPGVGGNLQNHFAIHLGGLLRPGARQPLTQRHYAMANLRASSGVDGARRSDLFLGLISRTGARAGDNGIALIAAALYDPFSRGRVGLRREGGAIVPSVAFNAFEHPLDAQRIVQAGRLALELLHSEPVSRTLLDTFMMPRNLPVKRLNAPGAAAAVGSALLARISSLPGPLRRWAVTAGIGRNRLLDGDVARGQAFQRVVMDSVTPMYHPVGTCALGTVVDADTAVRGVAGLHVADASIMPRIPRANTNLSALMIGERAADLIRTSLRASA